MRGLLWPLAAVAAFSLGWGAAALVRTGPVVVPGVGHHETPTEPTGPLPARGAEPPARAGLVAPGEEAGGFAAGAVADGERRDQTAAPRAEAAWTVPLAAASPPSRPAGAPGPGTQVQAALDRFQRYLQSLNDPAAGRDRWRQVRELLDELRAMGPAAGQALMQVLATGQDTDERRAAARLLGQLQVVEALPILREVIERDSDVLLRRAAAAGLRQLRTPDALPVMERILAQAGEDRFVRLSAAVGLADSGRPLGVAGLAAIFEESTADGRGRELAFRALAGLKDERPLPFMREIATSQAEPAYRVQAIRYLSTLGDRQALPMLQALSQAPGEQPSIRDAAGQAYALINGSRP